MTARIHPHQWPTDPLGWYHSAACRDLDVSVFYPLEGDRGVLAARRERHAKQICATCPVIRICLTIALAADERHGIWGGLNPHERDRLSQTLGQPS